MSVAIPLASWLRLVLSQAGVIKLTLVLGVLFLAGSAVAQLLPQGDAKPISLQEARLFGSATCKDAEALFSDALLEEWGTCRYLEQGSDPLILFELGPALIPFSVFYGSFTEPGAQEVLVTLLYEGMDCCAERTVLFRREGQGWLPMRLLKKTFAPSYLVFTTVGGRTLVLRRRDVSGLGVPFFDDSTSDYVLGFELSVTDIGPVNERSSLLVDFRNPELNCLFPYDPGARYAEAKNWSRRDINDDGFLDLVLKLEVTALADVRCGAEGFSRDPRQSQPTLVRLVFLFDGQGFRPTAETERFKQYSQKSQGEAF